MKITVKHALNDEFLVAMISTFLYSNSRATKKDFLMFLKDQVRMFGSDYDSQFGEEERVSTEARTLYKKWFNKR